MKSVKLILLIMALLVLGVLAHAQEDTTAALNFFLEEIAPDDGPAVSARITIGDQTWAAAGGRVDVTKATAAQPDNRFRIASMSKTFTAVALLLLAEDQILSLDDPVSKWVPQALIKDLANANRASLGQLATMTAGIPEYLNDVFLDAVLENPAHLWTPEQVLQFALDEPALFDPGDDFEYVNTNYILLQLAIESAAGKPLHEVIRQRIIEPLQLRDTYTQIQESLPGEFVHGYEDIDDDDQPDDVTNINDGAGLGDGGLVSTTADLARFYQALFIDETLLSEESLQWMVDANEAYEYGIGLEVTPSKYGPLWGHTGSVLGFSGAVFYAPELEAVVVILYASSALDHGHVLALLQLAHDEIMGDE